MLALLRVALFLAGPALGSPAAPANFACERRSARQITTGSIDPKLAKGPDAEQRVQALQDANFAFLVPGTPADVYVMVARGAMSCCSARRDPCAAATSSRPTSIRRPAAARR